MPFCRLCGKEFKDYRYRTGWFSKTWEREFCKACKPLSEARTHLEYNRRTYCVRYGKLLLLKTRYLPNGKTIKTTYNRKICKECRYASYPRKKNLNSNIDIIYECPCDHPQKHNHHFDYDQPNLVIRLCPICHVKEHTRLRALNKTHPRKEEPCPKARY